MQVSQSLLIAEAKTRMTFAFIFYQEDGIDAVRKLYPDQYEFVLANKDKTLNEVRVVIENILIENFKLKRVS